MSRYAPFIIRITRLILKPPAVELAQAPVNISSARMPLAISGQVLKSAVAKPVVEMMDVVWKKPSRRAFPRLGAVGSNAPVIPRVASTTSPR